MPYSDHFRLADDVLTHLDTVIGEIVDPFLSSRYVGFVSVVATTVYELAVRDIFCNFAVSKHEIFGHYVTLHFNRINGRIKTKTIKNEHVARFGKEYVQCLQDKLDEAEQSSLLARKVSILSSYNNLIVWRNQFAHEGRIPETVTYAEIKRSYQVGKEVIHCLAATMQ